MRKTSPPSTLDRLFLPNLTHGYFEGWREHHFRPEAADYDQVNAWWLAEACLLAYADDDYTRGRLDASQLAAEGFRVEFFAGIGTHCYVLHDDRAVIVVFRGTQIDNFWGTVVDLITDLKAVPVPDGAGGLVHFGFLKGMLQVWEGVRGHVAALVAGGRRALWVTGHSLGGALATLAADRLARTPGVEVRGLYTFGSPRVGDENFRQRLNALGLGQKTYRIVNNFDAVARVPPELVFKHVGLLKFIDGEGRLSHLGPGANLPHETRLSETSRALIPAAAFFATAPILPHVKSAPLPVPKPLADHSPLNYAIHLWNDFNP
jgi:hypothetical protein